MAEVRGGSDKHFYVDDQVESTSIVTSNAGAVEQRLEYKPYGEFSSALAGNFSPDFGFAYSRRDPITGLYDFGARVYDPHFGRFLSADPLLGDAGDPNALNPYGYARWNPVSVIDIGGLSPGSGGSTPFDWFFYFLNGNLASFDLSEATPPTFSTDISGTAGLGGSSSFGSSSMSGGFQVPSGSLNASVGQFSAGNYGLLHMTYGQVVASSRGEEVAGLPESSTSPLSSTLVEHVTSYGSYPNNTGAAGSLGAGLINMVPGAYFAGQSQIAWQQGRHIEAVGLYGAALGDATLFMFTLGGTSLATRGTGTVAAEISVLSSRAGQIHATLDSIAQVQRTTAILRTQEGIDIVAGGARDLAAVQRAALGSGEVASRLPGAHAEITALEHATRAGLTPKALAVTRAICPACAAAIERWGGTLTSESTARF